MQDLTIIIPAYNEQESLKSFLPELLDFVSVNKCNLIIVNDGSSDNTADVLSGVSHPQVKSFHHKVNMGYGGAVKTGIRNCTTKYAVTIDADGQHYTQDVKKVYDYFLQQNADMVVGSRKGHKENWYRAIGKGIIRGIAKILLPLNIYDINSGLKMFETQIAKNYISLCPDGYAFCDIIAMVFISKKKKVLETPINIRPRTEGKSKISTITAFETIKHILSIVILFNPMKIFLPISVFLILGGVLWGIQFLVADKGVSVGAMMSIVSGIIFFMMGLLAEQLAEMRKNSVDD